MALQKPRTTILYLQDVSITDTSQYRVLKRIVNSVQMFEKPPREVAELFMNCLLIMLKVLTEREISLMESW